MIYTYSIALYNWYDCVKATNTLTLNKLQLTGIITTEYLDHIKPVAANAADCDTLICEGCLLKISPIPAKTSPYTYKKVILLFNREQYCNN